MTSMNERQVRRLLRTTQGELSLRGFAREIGVSAQYLSEISRGLKQPSGKVLQYLNLEKRRVVTVRYIPTIARKQK